MYHLSLPPLSPSSFSPTTNTTSLLGAHHCVGQELFPHFLSLKRGGKLSFVQAEQSPHTHTHTRAVVGFRGLAFIPTDPARSFAHEGERDRAFSLLLFFSFPTFF